MNPSKTLTLFLKAAKILSRQPEETERLDSRSVLTWKWSFLSLLFLSIAAGLYFGTEPSRNEIAFARPTFEISKTDWRVAYFSVDPQSEALWNSPFKRGDVAHFEKVRAQAGRPYWLAYEVPVSAFESIRSERANYLVLGFLNSEFNLYLDGNLWLHESGEQKNVPLAFPLPMNRFHESRALRIVIEMKNNSSYAFPDYFSVDAIGLGNATFAQVTTRLYTFRAETRPAVIFGMSAVIAIFFCVFWYASPRRQEYWYLAVFLLVGALFHLIAIDFSRNFDRKILSAAGAFLKFYQAAFAFFLGLAYARARLTIFKWGIPVALVIPFTFLYFAQDTAHILAVGQSVTRWLAPVLTAISGLYCWVQVYHLRLGNHHVLKSDVRIRRLKTFSFGLFLLAFSYLLKGVSFTGLNYVFWDPFVQTALVMALSFIVVLEYREQEKALQKTHLSKYFKRPQLIASVQGVGVMMDLKASVEIKRQYGLETYDEVLDRWYAMVAAVAQESRGELLTEGGDSVILFFDYESPVDPWRRATSAIREVVIGQVELAQQLKVSCAFELRAAICPGEIRPAWKKAGGLRKPSYYGGALIELSRLVELEKQAPSPKSQLVVEMCYLEKVLPILKGAYLETALVDKDQLTRKVAVIPVESSAEIYPDRLTMAG